MYFIKITQNKSSSVLISPYAFSCMQAEFASGLEWSNLY